MEILFFTTSNHTVTIECLLRNFPGVDISFILYSLPTLICWQKLLSCYNRENHKVGVFTNRVRSPVGNGVRDLYCWNLPLSKRTVPEVTWYLTFYSSKLFSWIQSFIRSFCKLTGPGDKCKIEHLASWSLKLWSLSRADHYRKVLFFFLFNFIFLF